MFKWYRDSAICYVYMQDVGSQPPGWETSLRSTSFSASRWFSRGWTLQELIAPDTVIFLARDWSDMGSKFSLEALIVQCTEIPVEVLRGQPLVAHPAAERMSWADRRKTTRDEDMAYCLLGLFDIHRPLLYGEGGEKAFLRLQEEIWRKSEDLTLLIWSPSTASEAAYVGGTTGVFAVHPVFFDTPVMAKFMKESFNERIEHLSSRPLRWREVFQRSPDAQELIHYSYYPIWVEGLDPPEKKGQQLCCLACSSMHRARRPSRRVGYQCNYLYFYGRKPKTYSFFLGIPPALDLLVNLDVRVVAARPATGASLFLLPTPGHNYVNKELVAFTKHLPSNSCSSTIKAENYHPV